DCRLQEDRSKRISMCVGLIYDEAKRRFVRSPEDGADLPENSEGATIRRSTWQSAAIVPRSRGGREDSAFVTNRSDTIRTIRRPDSGSYLQQGTGIRRTQPSRYLGSE